VPGEPQTGLERLGWGEAMAQFRPFLSHSELEVLLARPADLYDQLNSLLGLEVIAEITQRLAASRKEEEASVKAAKAQLPGLKSALEACDDDRAVKASKLISTKKVDLDALQFLATGGSGADQGEIAVLSRLRDLDLPKESAVAAVSAQLLASADQLELLDTSAVRQASETADLLDAALRHFETHGPGDCPVCGRTAALNAAWGQTTRAQIEQLRRASAELDQARSTARLAVSQARQLVLPVPGVLTSSVPQSVDISAAVQAWQRWSDLPPGSTDPAGLRVLAEHLSGRHSDLGPAVAAVGDAAGAEYERRQGDWAPLAAQLASWCGTERAGTAAKATLERIKRVESWLKDANHELRNERLRPFAEGTAALWSQLRQQSNVDLIKITLEGSATRRSVDFEVTVDGKDAPGLGVMSQGEVNALALSVFLPRATSPASALRFVIIDDPVQAMDPSKVDGMARVLSEVATTRQVVVFTHDERLPAALRYLDLPARIVRVDRRLDSVVDIEYADDPVERYLRRAGALAADDKIPPVVTAKVIPGVCRSALEAVSYEITRRRRLGRGDTHESVEDALTEPTTLVSRLALAILDDGTRGGDVYVWLNNNVGGWSYDTVQACNKGSHGRSITDMRQLVGNTRQLVNRLRERLA
jgi:hypothetical protein